MAKILVVDDDPEIRVLLNALLADDLGHELAFASDGDAGVGRYDRVRPDLVITDLVMPKLSGLLLIEHLHSLYPDKIIAISGSTPLQLDRAKAAGASASLAKPIERDELIEAIDQALAAPGPWDRERKRD